jgi:tRNA pseudouridine38-40 synthase
MNHYLLTIQYKGTRYKGWQIQPDQKTIQGELNKVIEKIFPVKEVRTIGSGRTDAGVHALDQKCKLSMDYQIELQSLVKALNSNLPIDIRVMDAQLSDEKFMPTVDVKQKEYRYYFTNQKIADPLSKDNFANISYALDVPKMHKAAALFLGEHDFKNFYTLGTEVKTTVRNIFECELHHQEASDLATALYYLRVVGNGFLKQMVRMMAGALWEVGRGKLTLDQIKQALSAENDNKIAPVAPPEGLYLFKVTY